MERGSHEELLEKGGLYSKLISRQVGPQCSIVITDRGFSNLVKYIGELCPVKHIQR